MSRHQINMKRRMRLGLCCTAMTLLAALGGVSNTSREHPVTIESLSAAEQAQATVDGHDDPDEGLKPFDAASVCARCHVVSVLEWGISGHVDVQTTCQECHGASAGHVANERNEVKPQMLFRGDDIAQQLCLTCHNTGCPSTDKVASCQQCHHVHALIHPDPPQVARLQTKPAELERLKQYASHIARGRRHVEREQWKSAATAFQRAMDLFPTQRAATMGLAMCRRRMNPALEGFQTDADTYDPATGLPHDVKVEGLDIAMRLVPPGTFDMGSDMWDDSRPVHTVAVDAFYLGRHEITQAQWAAVMETKPAAHQGDAFAQAADMPVEHISWEDCQTFIQRLNDRVPGGGFRLPTEAQWEYACRAGGSATFQVEDVPEYAWCRRNSGPTEREDERQLLRIDANAPRPVGTRRPNRWGFFDMLGNVSEWCSSPWRPYVDRRDDVQQRTAQTILRIVRGGNYLDSASDLDPALRHAVRPQQRLRFTGLRLARSVPPLERANSRQGRSSP